MGEPFLILVIRNWIYVHCYWPWFKALWPVTYVIEPWTRTWKHTHTQNKIQSYFNKILSITQQSDASKIVKVDMVKQLGQDLMVHYKQHFPFAMISPSVHQMCAHSWELFSLTEGRPIAIYAEQSGEAWNKHIRAYKSGPSARARQCSIKLNTQDIFTRMLIQSHPIVASKRKLLKCKRCEKYGHTIRSCPLNVASVEESERSFIESCYIWITLWDMISEWIVH